MSEHDHDHDEIHDAQKVTRIEANQHGQPCFGCYFTALFNSFTPAQLAAIPVEAAADVPPEMIDFARRFGATMAAVADGTAAQAVEAAGADAPEVLAAFQERFGHMLQLHLAPVAGRAN